MEFDEGHYAVSGRVPECGAIFMSNNATKRECLRLGLFGLPASQGPFVKQVKSGMLLFLFEYEKRQLHGVFQACSNGAMDIVPHAFRSSGKQFPAQVWLCASFLHPFDFFQNPLFSLVSFLALEGLWWLIFELTGSVSLPQIYG